MIDPLFSMALMTGLLGSGHCIGMCGGIVGALSLSGDGRRGGLSFHLLYNAGRIATYTVIGLLVGWLGSAIAYTDIFRQAARMILVGSDLFVILIGLGTTGAFPRLNVMRLEFPGPLRTMTAAVGGLRQLPAPLAGIFLGLLFGLLPCGFLYAMAITAAQSADPQKGALILFAFGLGTAPSIFLLGGAAQWLSRTVRRAMLRSAGLLLSAMGLYNLYRHLRMMGLVEPF